MSKASGPKDVRARQQRVLNFRLFGPAPPRSRWRRRRLDACCAALRKGGRMRNNRFGPAMVALATCTHFGAPAGAQQTQIRAPVVATRGPLTAEVAGVRLRAAPAEGRAALVRSGYRITSDTQIASFGQQVQAETAQRRGLPPKFPKQAGTGKIIATGRNQEYLEVEFIQAVGGSQASRVTVTVPGTAISAINFRRQVRARYGEPDNVRHQGADMSWCSPETMRNCGADIAVSGPLDNQYPSIKASAYEGGGARNLSLHIGETALRELAVAKEEAVRRLAPPVDRAAF